MQTIESGSIAVPQYQQLRIAHDAHAASLWVHFAPSPRPCFNTTLLNEILDVQARLARTGGDIGLAGARPIQYLVWASDWPGVYNMGGDLDLFSKLIERRDRDGLRDYARLCVDAVYQNATQLGLPGLTTISLVQGTALGGGFECALSANVVVAERGARLGFPEILFNLFPGMGALSLLARRIPLRQAEKLVASGDTYAAEELYDMGVIDVLVDEGEGVRGVREYIRRHQRMSIGYNAIKRAGQRVQPFSLEELTDIVEMWVDAAMQVTPRDLRTMMRLTSAQEKKGVDRGSELSQTPEAVAV